MFTKCVNHIRTINKNLSSRTVNWKGKIYVCFKKIHLNDKTRRYSEYNDIWRKKEKEKGKRTEKMKMEREKKSTLVHTGTCGKWIAAGHWHDRVQWKYWFGTHVGWKVASKKYTGIYIALQRINIVATVGYVLVLVKCLSMTSPAYVHIQYYLEGRGPWSLASVPGLKER